MRSAIFHIAAEPENAGSVAVQRLAEQWWHSTIDWEVLVAVTARAAAGDPRYRAPLMEKIDINVPMVAAAAIRGLAGPGDAREVELLRRIVSHPEPTLRWAYRAAVVRLMAIGSPEAQAALRTRVLTALEPPWRDDRTWLARHGTAAIPLFIEKLSDPRWWHEGPYALGELRAVDAVPALCQLARSTGGLPTAAIEALGKIGSVDAVPTLLGLAEHPHHDVRDHALRALHRIGDPQVVDAAIAACDDPHPVVRDRAARILAQRGDARAVPQLIRLCDGRHAARAAAALARIGDPRALPTLWHLFRSAHSRDVRHTAGRGIAGIDAGGRVYVHGADVHVRRAYMWLLGYKPQWNPGYQLRQALGDGDPLVRANAAAALSRLGDPSDAEPIRPLLDDPDPRARAQAATALGRIGHAQARTWLAHHRGDPHRDVRSAITAALHEPTTIDKRTV